MSDRTKTSSKAYLAQADSWAKDRQAALDASRRTAWIVATAAMIVAICEALALMFLMPLKRIEPYTLMVDRQTGYVQLLKPLDPELISSNAALTQSFLAQYVIAREGFDIDSIQSEYRKVAAWSSGAARSGYLAQMPASNPASPLIRYPRTSVVDVAVKSVTALGNRAAMVRFETIRRDAGQQPMPGRPWVAVIHYEYVSKPMTVEDRFINPLGFQVLRYDRSAEALTPPDAAAPFAVPVSIKPVTIAPSTATNAVPAGLGSFRRDRP